MSMTHSSDRKNAEKWPLEIERRIADQGPAPQAREPSANRLLDVSGHNPAV